MASECFAPVFKKNNVWACVWLRIIYAVTIMLLIIGTLGLILLSESGRCMIKQYQYRGTYCTVGNSDSNVPI